MAIDKVRPLKLEDPASGGTETDEFPTPIDPREDHIQTAGLVFEDATHSDEVVRIWRDGTSLLFSDGSTAVPVGLSDLSGGGVSEAQHRVLRQLIHFIDDGPATGFASGAYKETTPTGPFPTSEIWWESSAKLKKIVSLDTTWTGPRITQEVWKVYATDGSTVLATVTDVVAYSGVFETSRTRTIS